MKRANVIKSSRASMAARLRCRSNRCSALLIRD